MEANFIVPNHYHDIAKAFLQGLNVKFETSQDGPDNCCFALYDINREDYLTVQYFITQECEGVQFPN